MMAAAAAKRAHQSTCHSLSRLFPIREFDGIIIIEHNQMNRAQTSGNPHSQLLLLLLCSSYITSSLCVFFLHQIIVIITRIWQFVGLEFTLVLL